MFGDLRFDFWVLLIVLFLGFQFMVELAGACGFRFWFCWYCVLGCFEFADLVFGVLDFGFVCGVGVLYCLDVLCFVSLDCAFVRFDEFVCFVCFGVGLVWLISGIWVCVLLLGLMCFLWVMLLECCLGLLFLFGFGVGLWNFRFWVLRFVVLILGLFLWFVLWFSVRV